jgi:hypothetical protein
MNTPIVDVHDILRQLYSLNLHEGSSPIVTIERYLQMTKPVDMSDDLRRNEPNLYKTLFVIGGSGLEQFFHRLLLDMKNRPFASTLDTIVALSFIQLVVAKALWKYHLSVAPSLEAFARNFDRLDIPAERRRLYEFAQQQ